MSFFWCLFLQCHVFFSWNEKLAKWSDRLYTVNIVTPVTEHLKHHQNDFFMLLCTYMGDFLLILNIASHNKLFFGLIPLTLKSGQKCNTRNVTPVTICMWFYMDQNDLISIRVIFHNFDMFWVTDIKEWKICSAVGQEFEYKNLKNCFFACNTRNATLRATERKSIDKYYDCLCSTCKLMSWLMI